MQTHELLDEMIRQLDRLDQQQALMQAQDFLAQRYAQWCNAVFCDLQYQRDQLKLLIHQWEEADQYYQVQDGG